MSLNRRSPFSSYSIVNVLILVGRLCARASQRTGINLRRRIFSTISLNLKKNYLESQVYTHFLLISVIELKKTDTSKIVTEMLSKIQEYALCTLLT